MSDRWFAMRQLYESGNIVADGTTPFPENEQSIRDGIAVEFRYFIDFWTSFYVPRNVSFGIPEAKIMPYVAFPFESIPASFAYV